MRISFTGDLSITGSLKKSILDDTLKIDKEILNIFQSSDYNIVNLEGPATNNEIVYDKHIEVKSPLETIKYFKDKNINIFNLANNHTFDAGLDGFLECKNEIIKNNCEYFGSGEDIEEASNVLFIEKDNIKIGLIGVGQQGSYYLDPNKKSNEVFSDMNISLIKKQIEHSKKNADWTIINFHNGAEYNFYPINYVQDKLKRFIDFGADIVIGHHPHVPQGIQNYKNGTIFYSLGNFLFDLVGHKSFKNTDLSLVVSLDFTKDTYKYEYVLTQHDVIELTLDIVKDKTLLKWYKKINKRTNSKYIKTYSFFDYIRTIFFNPFFYKRRLANYLIFLTIFLRPISYTKGNQRKILEDLLNYLKFDFLMKRIEGESNYNKENEY